MNESTKRWILEQLRKIVATVQKEHSIDLILTAMVDTTNSEGMTVFNVNACALDVASMNTIAMAMMAAASTTQCDMVGHHPMCDQCPRNLAVQQHLPKKGACVH